MQHQTEFYALSLRAHTFLADVPLHDVWAVDLPTHGDGVTLSEFLRRASQGGINRLPPVARALIRLRLFLGRIFRLEAEPKDALAASFGSRLTPEDRARSFSPLAFHADAPLYIPGAKTRIPAELVTCEHICDST